MPKCRPPSSVRRRTSSSAFNSPTDLASPSGATNRIVSAFWTIVVKRRPAASASRRSSGRRSILRRPTITEGADRRDLPRRRGCQKDPIHPDLHRLEEQLRFRGVMDLDEKPRPASLEMCDQVLDRDDLPVFRPDDDMFRRSTQRADRGLILRGPYRREAADRFVIEREDVVRQEDRREVADALEVRVRLR